MQERKKIVVIGSVALGPKAAARARRLMPNADITMVEQGQYISYASCGFPLYLAGMASEMDELISTSAGAVRDVEFFAKEKNIKVLIGTVAKSIDRENKEVVIHDLGKNLESRLPYDELVLATGAKPIVPPLPGVRLKGVKTLHTPVDALAIRESVKQGAKKIAVIGGGLIGLEAADALVGSKREITVFEMKEQLLPGLLDPEIAQLVRDQVEQGGVKVCIGDSVVAFEGDEQNNVKFLVTKKGKFEVDLVILACGVRPNVDLARDCGLDIGKTGAISVDEFLNTSDPHIYAGGDCAETRNIITGEAAFVPLASTANKQGRIIGSNLSGKKERYPGVLGTGVLQIFDYNVGKTGLTESYARQKGYPVVSVLVAGKDSAHYHPMSGGGMIKLIAHAETRKLLGAQVVGQGEVIKRLDVFATAIQLGANIDQVANLDLGYAPPFATPIDLGLHTVNTLKNLNQKLAQKITPTEVVQMLKSEDSFIVLEVRNPGELRNDSLMDPRVINIPLNELRQRLGELKKDSKIITLCESGFRAYEAACILNGEGFTDVAFLEGGIYALPGVLIG